MDAESVESGPVLACGCLEEQSAEDLGQFLGEGYPRVGVDGGGDVVHQGESFEDQLSLGLTAAVNARGWSSLPIAERDTKFAFRAATDRLAAHADSIEQFSSWFFWRDERKPANNRNSYRMPFADVFADGTVKLVPSAVYSAAAQLNGAHGALPIIPDAEKQRIRDTIDRIYAKFREMWNDPRQIPPWERPTNSAADEPVKASYGDSEEGNDMPIELIDEDEDAITASVNSSGWDSYPMAGIDRVWDSGAARQRLESWADGDMAKFRKGFLWYDSANADKLGAYKFPIADIINGTLTIIPRAVNNADARLSGANIPSADKGRIQGILNRIEARFRKNMTAAMAPTKPPADWFKDPMLTGPTRLRVTDEGRVYGHVAAWNSCHRGYEQCITPPRDSSGYKEFLTGTVLTADGSLVKAGHLTYGGGHAPLHLNASAAKAYYDEAGTSVAQVAAGMDTYGIWVAGAMEAGTGEVEAQQLRSHPLSGDWRMKDGHMEMIAALAVNTPGFPIDEPQHSLTASGETSAIMAAGILHEDGCGCVDVAGLEAKAATMRDADLRRRQRKLLGVQLTLRG